VSCKEQKGKSIGGVKNIFYESRREQRKILPEDKGIQRKVETENCSQWKVKIIAEGTMQWIADSVNILLAIKIMKSDNSAEDDEERNKNDNILQEHLEEYIFYFKIKKCQFFARPCLQDSKKIKYQK